MRAFLIDFENVKSAGLAGIENLTREDKVVILYSVNSNTLSFEMHRKILSCEAAVEYFQIRRGGKNSLDFQLSTLLGWMLASDIYSHLYIISNDSGFDALYDFWNSGYISTNSIVYRRATIALADAHSKTCGNCVVYEAEEDTPAGDEVSEESEETVCEAAPSEQPAAETEIPEETKSEDSEEEIHVIDLLLSSGSEEKKKVSSEVTEEKNVSDETQNIPVIDLFSALSPSDSEEEKQGVWNEDDQEEDLPSLEALISASEVSDQQENNIEERINRVAAALPAALSEIVTAEQRMKIAGDVVSSLGKQDFYRDIIRRYGQKKGLLVYKTVKSEYTSLKKLADA